jgi:hypothetical protein
VERFFSPLKPFLDKGAKDPVLLIDAVEKSADVTFASKGATGKLH